MAYKLIGKDFTPPDIYAKVTGRAKYAEDFRAEGMLYCKLALSSMPHARVKRIDASEAMKMPGVVAILTPDDVLQQPGADNQILYKEPVYIGAPIAAIAAIDELSAANAVEKLKIELEPLPFVVNPLDSLYPGGPNAREGGNVANIGLKLQTKKWTAADFTNAASGQLPLGDPAETWNYGDIEAGFKASKVIVEESFVTASYATHSLEPRSAMAYWQNGKCFLHGSSQSQTFMVPQTAAYIGIKPEDLIYIAEFCGGGFGSKGNAYPIMTIPAYLSKKTGRPVMMRLTRYEEYTNGHGRAGFQGWVKLGFRADGRLLAADIYVVADNGPNTGFVDFRNAGEALSAVYQPVSMRWRGIPVLTNTPPRSPQRGPGENQTAAALEPYFDKAARQLGIDRVAIRKINAPDNATGKIGAKREPMTSAYYKEALDKGAQLFNWEERIKRSGQKNGNKITGIGVGQAFHPSGSHGFDGLLRITPDGKLHVHTGVGNLGTYSYASTARIAAETLNYDWQNVVIERGDTRRALPWNFGQFGSNTNFTMARTNFVAAIDAKKKLLEIAAKTLGGSPDDYQLGQEAIVSKADPARSMRFADAAKQAIALGGAYSGQDIPADIHPLTKAAVGMIANTGLIGVAKDNLPLEGTPQTYTTGFMEIELDAETGAVDIKDYVAVTDCGTVIHPQNLHHQIKSGGVMGIGMARLERHVFDPHYGIPLASELYLSKPASYLDTPVSVTADAVDMPDPQSPLGTRGMGEPPLGACAAALLCAISDALGGHTFNRTPVVGDMIINHLAKQSQAGKPLQVNSV